MQPTKILLVDDEADAQDLLVQALDIQGYKNIKATRSAKGALHMLKNERFDLVISDYLMPEIDGLELFRQLKSFETPMPKFLILTGIDKIDELQKEGIEVLDKPFQVDELVKKVKQLLAK